MAWRKWVVRGLVFSVAGGMAAAAFTYQHWTNPAVVRRLVIANLEAQLPGARVSLESAQLRLLGGITFRELRLSRRDDPERTDFLYVPSGTISHDKEQLLSGKLAIRRIDWYQPRISLIRKAKGSWNLAGLLAPPTPEVAVPTIVLQQATLRVEDQQARPGAPPLEIREVNLVLMNDPHRPPAISLLTFKGTAVADLAGAIQVEGTWERLSSEFAAKVHVPSFTVDGALVQTLSICCPEAGVHARHLRGTATLQAEIQYHPEAQQPWHHDVHGQLSQGSFRHAQLPFPLEHLEASVHCVDGHVTLEKLTALSGAAQVQLSGNVLALQRDTDILDGRLEVKHLAVSKALFEAIPNLKEIEDEYSPQGAFTVVMDFCRRGGQWREHGTIQLEDMAGTCAKFPYRLEHITGTIEQEIGPDAALDFITVDLVGNTGSGPVLVQGDIRGKKPARVDFRIRAKDVPIDEKLCAALQPEFQKLVRSFRPRGYADLDVHLHRPQGERQFSNHYALHFHDASVTYDVFPYPLEGVSGTLLIQPDHWEYRDFQATHKGGDFHSQGKSVRTPHGNGATIEITGSDALMDAELMAALQRPALVSAWEKLNPSGRMSFKAQVDCLPGQKDPEIDVIVSPRGCALRPEFFPYVLADLRGTVHYRRHEVELDKLRARHESTLLYLEKGKVGFNEDGGCSVHLVNLLGDPIVPDAEFVRALPPTLGKACTSLQVREPLSLRTNLTIAVPADRQRPPRIQWDGGVRFKDASLRAGLPFERVNGVIWCSGEHRDGTFGNIQGHLQLKQATVYHQPLRDIQSQLIVDANKPDFLVLPNLDARLYGGNIGGSVRVEIGSSVGYEADLTASQIQLEEVSRANQLGPNAQQTGPLNASLYLKGQGTELTGLKGWGSIDVESGKMYNLPLLLDLLKFLSLRWPDRTLFEEAHARFRIDGPRVQISRIDLLGAAVSLGGSGTVYLDSGAFTMELYAVWARIVQLSPPMIKEIWPTVSKQLLKIKMNGKIGEPPRFEREPVPGLIEPLEKVRERLAGKQGG